MTQERLNRGGPGVAQEWFRSCPGAAQENFRSGTGVAQECTRSVPGVAQKWHRRSTGWPRSAPGVAHQELPTRSCPGVVQDQQFPSPGMVQE